MHLSNENQLPAVIAVNLKYKNAASGTWHAYPNQKGPIYVQLDVILNSMDLLADAAKLELKQYVEAKGWTV